MAYDEQHDDGLGGRSRTRREVTESWRWAAEIVELPAWHRRALPLTDELRDAVELGTTITSFIARKRQLGFIDGMIRLLDEAWLDALRHAIDNPPGDPEQQARRWSARLREGGDEAIDAFLAAFPAAERQRVRQLARQGRPGALERYVVELLEAA